MLYSIQYPQLCASHWPQNANNAFCFLFNATAQILRSLLNAVVCTQLLQKAPTRWKFYYAIGGNRTDLIVHTDGATFSVQ